MAVHPFGGDGGNIVFFVIPIVLIIMCIAFAMLRIFLDYRRRKEIVELHHKERIAAIEKGADVAALPKEYFDDFRGTNSLSLDEILRRALLWLLPGFAAIVVLSYENQEWNWWGLLPTSVGLAYLISYFVERARRRQK